MTKKSFVPRLKIVDRAGKTHRAQAAEVEIELAENKRLLLRMTEEGSWADLEIEALAENDDDAPVISMQAAACNVLNVRVDVRQDLFPVDVHVPAPGKTAPVLALKVQKVLTAAEKAKTPKKHKIRRWAQAAIMQSATVTIRLVGEEEGRTLNRDYRHKDYATNVLTFTYDEPGGPLVGDIVLCVPVILREAETQNKNADAHFAHLVIHGMLHLQGFDHETEEDAQTMERRERDILNTLGFADPYA